MINAGMVSLFGKFVLKTIPQVRACFLSMSVGKLLFYGCNLLHICLFYMKKLSQLYECALWHHVDFREQLQHVMWHCIRKWKELVEHIFVTAILRAEARWLLMQNWPINCGTLVWTWHNPSNLVLTQAWYIYQSWETSV